MKKLSVTFVSLCLGISSAQAAEVPGNCIRLADKLLGDAAMGTFNLPVPHVEVSTSREPSAYGRTRELRFRSGPTSVFVLHYLDEKIWEIKTCTKAEGSYYNGCSWALLSKSCEITRLVKAMPGDELILFEATPKECIQTGEKGEEVEKLCSKYAEFYAENARAEFLMR